MATAFNPAPIPQALIRKIGALPRERIAEVEDFVDFIAMKDSAMRAEDRALVRAATTASSPAFAAVWNNPEDDVYDAL
jgi:hypothetical protein